MLDELERPARRARPALPAVVLGITTVLMASLLLEPLQAGSDRATYVMFSSIAALASLAALELRRPSLSRRAVLACCGVLLAVAAIAPLHRSRDVWSYAVLGRIVSEHGGDPYVDSPKDFPDDPYLARVSPEWRNGVTVYGPAFVAIAAAITEATGTSSLATRIAFQSLAALAVGAALIIIDRKTRDPLAVALIGLNPVTILYTVGGGHNDALLGLGVLVAVIAARSRPGLAGASVALAALVKIVAILAVPVLVIWLWHHRLRSAAAWLAAAAGATVVGGYALIGRGHAITALKGAHDLVSWSSIWRPVQDLYVAQGQHVLDTHFGQPALILVAVVAALLAASHLRDREPDLAVAAVLLAYVLGAAYTLVWYLAWVLPVLGLRIRSRTTQVALVYATVLLIAAEHPTGPSQDGLDRSLDHAVGLLHVVAVLALVVLCVGAARRLITRT